MADADANTQWVEGDGRRRSEPMWLGEIVASLLAAIEARRAETCRPTEADVRPAARCP